MVLERLAPLPVTSRGMFGGMGLYFEGKFFGTITDGHLYFRTDEDNRKDFTSRRMPHPPAEAPSARPEDRRPELPCTS
jgi:DNA transformation protein